MSAATEGDPIQRLYSATRTPELVQVPPLSFLTIDGHGDPNTSPTYAAAVQALFSVSYAAKFAVRKAGGPAFKVSFLEGLWWAADLSTFVTGDKAEWDWTLMIRQPDVVTAELGARVIEDLVEKKKLPATVKPDLVTFTEGSAAQVLHIGPYSTEASTIVRLHAFIREQGFSVDGHRHKHHEIYLGDPRRSAPERLRTIIRQPYAAVNSEAG